MSLILQRFTIADTSPAAASTVIGSARGNLETYDWFTIDAALVGATGGTLDVYLQRQVAETAEITNGLWTDWLHFPQLAAGAAAVKYYAASGPYVSSTAITVTGQSTDASATPALAANTFLGGHPGFKVRAVYVAGASTSAGAAVTIHITGWKRRA